MWNVQNVPHGARHRVFVSYHHKDEYYREEWDRLFGHLFLSTSVGPGEIDDSNSADYIKRLIQENYISHSSVIVVLVGPQTYCRKHVDWEISAGLNKKVGGYSGLLGIWLPHHPDFGTSWKAPTTPARLADNLSSGYAKAWNWTEDPAHVSARVEQAFRDRLDKQHLIDNSRPQLARNLCG